jgi:hypothetical protein
MITLGIMGGLGAPEILILGILVLVFFASPIMWYQERKQRKYWQAKAEDYEKRLLNKS